MLVEVKVSMNSVPLVVTGSGETLCFILTNNKQKPRLSWLVTTGWTESGCLCESAVIQHCHVHVALLVFVGKTISLQTVNAYDSAVRLRTSQRTTNSLQISVPRTEHACRASSGSRAEVTVIQHCHVHIACLLCRRASFESSSTH